MLGQRNSNSWLARFRRNEDGATSIEFALMMPLFFLLFTMAFEVGLLSVRQVMLEHGLNETVRQVRLGTIRDPEHEILIDEVCEAASIIPDCKNQLRLEMIPATVTSLNPSDITDGLRCRDRSVPDSDPLLAFTNTGGNNDLMVLRACALFDPLLPLLGIGKEIPKQSGDGYALFAVTSYVLEPFR